MAESSRPLQLDQLTDAYYKQLGYKCNVDDFLDLGESGLAAALKQIPHIATVYTDSRVCVCE